jgi:hypothetical protein
MVGCNEASRSITSSVSFLNLQLYLVAYIPALKAIQNRLDSLKGYLGRYFTSPESTRTNWVLDANLWISYWNTVLQTLESAITLCENLNASNCRFFSLLTYSIDHAPWGAFPPDEATNIMVSSAVDVYARTLGQWRRLLGAGFTIAEVCDRISQDIWHNGYLNPEGNDILRGVSPRREPKVPPTFWYSKLRQRLGGEAFEREEHCGFENTRQVSALEVRHIHRDSNTLLS